MALTTYSELKTSLASWLHRSDLSNVLGDFITLCESDFNRRLRLATMETRVTADFDEGYEDLPDDFLEMREIKINSNPVRALQYLSPHQMSDWYPTSESANPEFYTIVGTQVRMNKTPTEEAEMVYYKKIPALSDTQTTNWMLTNHPDVYLYGSLAMAEPYVKNDKRVAMWKSLYEAALSQIENADRNARWPGQLVVRVA